MSSNAPDWKALIELYRQGASDVEIARELDVTIGKFHSLVQDSPAFAAFVEKGRTLAMAWWYEMGRKGLTMEKFNTSGYAFNMKNRFGWADKVETTDNTNKAPVDLDAMRAELASQMRKIAKKNPELLDGAKLHLIGNAND